VAQRPPRQAALPCADGRVHFASQAPQWSTVVCTSTHCDPQRVDAGAVQPVTHWNVPFELEQSGALVSHIFVQEPHDAGLERSVSQPS
jgi:hypothetical protein